MSRRSPPFQAAWWAVLAIVGLDYLSTLAYQPSLAYDAAGRLAPLGTIVVVLVTLLAALPVYLYLAGRSPHGGGAAALLRRLVPGWGGKLLILVLLGFTATDFVFTRTVSAAAAAEHLIHNPAPGWQSAIDRIATACREFGRSWDHPAGEWLTIHCNQQLIITLILLLISSALAIVLFRHFTSTIVRIAVFVVGIYLLLNLFVLATGLLYLARHPDVVDQWWRDIWNGHWHAGRPSNGPQTAGSIIGSSLGTFPRLALGLSGFELTMIVMPLVRGRPNDDPRDPRGRVADTRRLLVVAAIVGSIALLTSSFVTTLLIPPSAFAPGGAALHRAIAYLAHGGELATGDAALSPLFGPALGTIYDLSALAILCLAGASISVGLRDFVPPYLHRLGMELNWSLALGALIYLFAGIKLAVTIFFSADLDAQRSAYATAVLAVMTAAAFACTLDRRRRFGRWPWIFAAMTIGFAAGTIAAIADQRNGLTISLCFIAAILATSLVSRGVRATELRFGGFEFVDDSSRFLWQSLRPLEFPVLVPRRPGERNRNEKESEIRTYHRLSADVPIVFVEATLGDPSGFEQVPLMEIVQQDGRFVICIERCTSIPHVLAVVALELSRDSRPPELHFGWSDESPLTANLHFVLFGHGNVPWMVQHLINRAERDPQKRPRVIVG